jgi:hypothetical protein
MTTAILNRFAQFRSLDNVEYQLRDAHGNIKPLFQEYRLTQFLIKKGLISPLWINRWYTPLLSPFLGYWSTTKRYRNLITNAGFALAAGRLNGSGSPAAATYIAVGTGTNTAAVTDTALQTETATSGLSRANGTVSLVTTSVTNDTAQVTNTFSVTGSVAVTESGVLNAASTGTLLCRQVFSAINVVNGDSLAITWKVQMH